MCVNFKLHLKKKPSITALLNKNCALHIQLDYNSSFTRKKMYVDLFNLKRTISGVVQTGVLIFRSRVL